MGKKGRKAMGASDVAKEACEECRMKCLLVHGKRDPSPIVTSFFKIILEDSLSKPLVIPPRFAKTIMSLVDEKTDIEDSTGQCWKVKICRFGGKLVFKQGWHEFALDHSLEIGDFVLFYYIARSHFVVQVYDKSGCEKFKNGICKGRRPTKISIDSVPLDGRNSTATEIASSIDKGSEDELGLSSSSQFDSDAEMFQYQINSKDLKEVPVSVEKSSSCDLSNWRSEAETVQNQINDKVFNTAPMSVDKRLNSNLRSEAEKFQNQISAEDFNALSVSVDKRPSRNISNLRSEAEMMQINAQDVKAVPISVDKRSGCDISNQRPEADIFRNQINPKNLNAVPISVDKRSNSNIGNWRCEPVMPKDYELPFYMIDRDLVVEQEPNRSSLFDLSDFEMPKKKSGADEALIEKRSIHHSDVTGPSQTTQIICSTGTHTIDIERDGHQRENTGVSFGLSHLKMPEKNSNAGEKFKGPPGYYPIPELQNRVFSDGDPHNHLSGKDSVCQMKGISLSRCHGSVQKVTGETSGCSRDPPVIGNSLSDTKLKVFKKEQLEKVKENYDKKLKVFKKEQVEKVKDNYVQKPVMVKVEPEGNTDHLEFEGQDQIAANTENVQWAGRAGKVVKTENIELNDHSSFNFVDFCCTMTRDDQSFLQEEDLGFPRLDFRIVGQLESRVVAPVLLGLWLKRSKRYQELPTDLPSLSCNGRTKMGRIIILLRDPALKLWPVLYHEKSGFRVLTSGWESFAKANNIQKGDTCIFGVENAVECVFRLQITRE